MTSENRWRIALHEAGHGVAAIVMGGRCDGLALLDDSHGLCQSSELLGNRAAYELAAGPAAEVLKERYSVPQVTVKATPKTLDDVLTMPLFGSAPALAAQMAVDPEKRKDIDSDDRQIALWAIDGVEDTPERWAGRVAFAKRIAMQIVEKHAAEIVRIATALFENGALCRDEITELMKESK